jgi:hypothetical protein
MAGLLDGVIAKAIFKGFKGKLSKGELRRAIPSAGLDEYGDPNAETPAYFSVEGFSDEYSEFYKAQAGIPETDLKVAIFGQSIKPSTIPAKDDKVTFKGQWYQLKQVGVDPADALYECQAFRIPAPADVS